MVAQANNEFELRFKQNYSWFVVLASIFILPCHLLALGSVLGKDFIKIMGGAIIDWNILLLLIITGFIYDLAAFRKNKQNAIVLAEYIVGSCTSLLIVVILFNLIILYRV